MYFLNKIVSPFFIQNLNASIYKHNETTFIFLYFWGCIRKTNFIVNPFFIRFFPQITPKHLKSEMKLQLHATFLPRLSLKQFARQFEVEIENLSGFSPPLSSHKVRPINKGQIYSTLQFRDYSSQQWHLYSSYGQESEMSHKMNILLLYMHQYLSLTINDPKVKIFTCKENKRFLTFQKTMWQLK